MKTSRLLTILIAAVVCLSVPAFSQQDASIVFKFVWSQGTPAKYTITIHKNGDAEYVSEDRGLTTPQEKSVPVESNGERVVQAEDAASQDAFHKQFQASEALRQKIFGLAERANYFSGQFDFTKHAVAQTGSKTLSYEDSAHRSSTTYNYSEDPSIQELTEIFQGISQTIEGGRKLEFDRRFDKLSLDQDLKGLEDLSNEGHLLEVQAIAPLLQRIAADRTVMHIAQQRAERILRKAGQPVAPTSLE
jgi:hypothetical protein